MAWTLTQNKWGVSMRGALAESPCGFLFGQNCWCSRDRNPELGGLGREGCAWVVITGKWLWGSEGSPGPSPLCVLALPSGSFSGLMWLQLQPVHPLVSGLAGKSEGLQLAGAKVSGYDWPQAHP